MHIFDIIRARKWGKTEDKERLGWYGAEVCEILPSFEEFIRVTFL